MPEEFNASKYNVSIASLEKVQEFFIREVKRTGDRRIQLTVPDLAEKAGVSVATAHKATKVLENDGVLGITTFPSKKNANVYYINADIESFERERKEKTQTEYLKDLVASLTDDNKYLKHKVLDLEVEVRRLRKMVGLPE